mmetsp:Transcript_31532/g.49396  ORF Transcript_31532/g.49396 Transcript_31532/m.49396 type:complete len:100 (+) Transcript_31532:39-338(+)
MLDFSSAKTNHHVHHPHPPVGVITTPLPCFRLHHMPNEVRVWMEPLMIRNDPMICVVRTTRPLGKNSDRKFEPMRADDGFQCEGMRAIFSSTILDQCLA